MIRDLRDHASPWLVFHVYFLLIVLYSILGYIEEDALAVPGVLLLNMVLLPCARHDFVYVTSKGGVF